MGQTIETGRGQQGLTEEIRPFFRGTIAGKQDATALVSFVDDVVEVTGSRRQQRFESEVVAESSIKYSIMVGALTIRVRKDSEPCSLRKLSGSAPCGRVTTCASKPALLTTVYASRTALRPALSPSNKRITFGAKRLRSFACASVNAVPIGATAF